MDKVSHLNHTETDSVSGIAADTTSLAFVEQTIWYAHRAGPDGSNAFAIPPKPSALRVAILRAAHQLLDEPPVFADPLALCILGPDGEALLRSNPSPCDLPRLKGFRASLALRGRMAEDQWANERSRGVRQYVILGAGLDTFAYRNPNHGCRVFEVDLPDMVRWKRECLRRAGIQEPGSLTFVPTDFEHMSLAESLKQAGFDMDAPGFFSWLGVTFYLDEEAVMQTLRYVASLAPGSGVVFDYAVRPDLLPPQEQEAMNRIDKKMAQGEEPWKTHLAPDLLVETLRAMGFAEVDDLGPDELNARYVSRRTDGLCKSGITRIIRARV